MTILDILGAGIKDWLRQEASTGLDGSPGEPKCQEALDYIEKLEEMLIKLTEPPEDDGT